MKIDGIPGDFAFKAVYNNHGIWEVSSGIFFTKEEVDRYFMNKTYLWPIEIQEDGQIVYIPTQEELENGR